MSLVGAELAGTITRVLVQEKSVVHKGDLLVELRGDEIRASAEEAVARVSETDAELTLIEQDQARVKRLPERPDTGLAEAKDRPGPTDAARRPTAPRPWPATADRGRIRPHPRSGPRSTAWSSPATVEPRRDRHPGHALAPASST